MSDAQYWNDFCAPHAGGKGIVNSPFCRRIMADAAEKTETTGFNGRVWVFADGSKLIATQMVEMVR